MYRHGIEHGAERFSRTTVWIIICEFVNSSKSYDKDRENEQIQHSSESKEASVIPDSSERAKEGAKAMNGNEASAVIECELVEEGR